MNKRQESGPNEHDTSRSQETCVCSVGTSVEHYTTGIVGLVATIITMTLLYPWLYAMAEVTPVLASTWLVFGFAAIWLLFWSTLEMAWEWRAGRFRTG